MADSFNQQPETSVAQTILEQLGGRRFMVMTGAKNCLNHGDALSFKLPSRFARDGINYVKIVLNQDDLYDLEFGKIWGTKYTVLQRKTGIYNDMLRTVFTNVTGLDTHL